ncbi:hypothetical protein [Massilia sp. erpn]|uniref:hypothetical protein n=1 Tax=Massilia sp. erpn TaxID=2738142 RepID=UPI002103BC35|nr:hypothetical protein [Massilia sp. erpn]UTY59324.1 hypothetical protein HPQ68_20370 [Massilia sp. erpn]
MATYVVGVGTGLQVEAEIIDGRPPFQDRLVDHAGARHAADGIVIAPVDQVTIAVDGRQAAGAIVLEGFGGDADAAVAGAFAGVAVLDAVAQLVMSQQMPILAEILVEITGLGNAVDQQLPVHLIVGVVDREILAGAGDLGAHAFAVAVQVIGVGQNSFHPCLICVMEQSLAPSCIRSTWHSIHAASKFRGNFSPAISERRYASSSSADCNWPDTTRHILIGNTVATDVFANDAAIAPSIIFPALLNGFNYIDTLKVVLAFSIERSRSGPPDATGSTLNSIPPV